MGTWTQFNSTLIYDTIVIFLKQFSIFATKLYKYSEMRQQKIQVFIFALFILDAIIVVPFYLFYFSEHKHFLEHFKI